MTPANAGAAFFRFSTDDMLPRDRAAAVLGMHERCVLPVKPEPMEPLSGQPVRVNITQWALPGLGMMSGALCGLRQQIRPELGICARSTPDKGLSHADESFALSSRYQQLFDI